MRKQSESMAVCIFIAHNELHSVSFDAAPFDTDNLITFLLEEAAIVLQETPSKKRKEKNDPEKKNNCETFRNGSVEAKRIDSSVKFHYLIAKSNLKRIVSSK